MDKQPLSVRLPTIESQTELGVFLAALLIATYTRYPTSVSVAVS